MAFVISFSSTRFEVAAETPNPINPIAGESVLAWLGPELTRAGYQLTGPATEDWGWYSDVTTENASYTVGASADATQAAGPIDWVVQVEKTRSLKERLFGRNLLDADDPLCALIERLVRDDDQTHGVTVQRSR